MAEVGFPLTLPSDLAGRIALIDRYMTAGLDAVELHPDRARLVIYEDLATSPATELLRLMTFLGLPAEPEQLAVNAVPHEPGLEDPKVALTSSVHSGSVGRWRGELTYDVVNRARLDLARVCRRVVALSETTHSAWVAWQ